MLPGWSRVRPHGARVLKWLPSPTASQQLSQARTTAKVLMATPTDVEKKNVVEVYDKIAAHFSSTRYKPWPLIEKWLKELPVGSLVADIGCGNGKYMGTNPGAFFIGTDRSAELIKICKERGHECFVSDGLRLPYRSESFLHAISVAVIHHFSSVDNRLHALSEIFRVLKVGGEALVTVWAFEQEGKRKYEAQDVMIPWKLAPQFRLESQKPATDPSLDVPTPKGEVQVFDRYYHLFKKGELDELISQIDGFEVKESVWDRDNWYVIARRTR